MVIKVNKPTNQVHLYLLFGIIQKVYYIMFIIQNNELLQQAGAVILELSVNWWFKLRFHRVMPAAVS